MAVSKKKSTTKLTPSTLPHPPYFQMICEAITALKDRTGSSQPAIAKFIEAKYNSLLPPNFKKMLSAQLKKFVKSEKLAKVKNSYKISDSSEKVKMVAASVKVSQKKKVVVVIASGNAVDQKKPRKTNEKTKRLSQVKSPKKSSVANNDSKKSVSTGAKMKRLSQVKTPEEMKNKKVLTPVKRKAPNSSKPASKKVRA